MEHLQGAFDVSERRACRALEQPRSTQRYRAKRTPEVDAALVGDMRRHAAKHPRYGYRRVRALLCRNGWRVGLNRVQRLWRQEGLRVPQKRRKRRRLGTAENGCTRLAAERPNHVWGYDFVTDRTEDGRQLKLLTVVDEFTRECLAIHVARSIKAVDVIDQLAALFIGNRRMNPTSAGSGDLATPVRSA